MINRLQQLEKDALAEINSAVTEEHFLNIKTKYLGRKGLLTGLLRNIAQVPDDEKPMFGKLCNELKNALTVKIDEAVQQYARRNKEELLAKQKIDVTLPGSSIKCGRVHPVLQIRREICSFFSSFGFSIVEGPEIELDYYNFEALNIPKDHPARDMQDTFWTEDGNLLRTHTSCMQIRAMQRMKPPMRLIAPGRVFRYEATDASHENTFYQMEGLMIDRNISVSNLIHFMKTLLREIFKRDVKIRLRPGYFPFVEPGFELDINCLICGGSGCPVCKQSGWVELLPCGLVHPNVLKNVGIDPSEFTGFAFGLGLNRLVMMRYGIDDIRHFLSGDVRFVEQF